MESSKKSSYTESKGAKRKRDESERLKREMATRRLENKEEIKFKLPRFSGDVATLEQLADKNYGKKNFDKSQVNFKTAFEIYKSLLAAEHPTWSESQIENTASFEVDLHQKDLIKEIAWVSTARIGMEEVADATGKVSGHFILKVLCSTGTNKGKLKEVTPSNKWVEENIQPEVL